ncbi:MAG: carotenoid 1,2-hydratase [Hydrogenophaga sp.]|nr:carotenoid 1,2-hydratase [Hydrogenophaga sp.]
MNPLTGSGQTGRSPPHGGTRSVRAEPVEALTTRRHLLVASAGLLLANTRPARAQAPPPHRPGDTLRPRPLAFPRDHGSHNETRTEWWYLTGHAQDARGHDFGFQVTFFRSRVDGTQSLRSRLAARQLVFAHAAITDVQGQKLWHDERIGRWNGDAPAPSAPAKVFASTDDTDVALRNWFLRREADGGYRTRITGREIHIDLRATPTQAILLQGDRGFSRKGPQAEQASFYISHPQLAVSGTLGIGGERFAIQEGRAWLDHEWSEAILHPEAVGWDWVGMNLFNGDSLTAFRLRRADGSALWAGGSFRTAAHAEREVDSGPLARFAPDAVAFEPLRHWTSPLTNARYPVAWRLRTPAGSFTVQTVLDAQELDSRQSTGTVYWEGLSDLLDASGQRVGRGYLEMTGYSQRLVL